MVTMPASQFSPSSLFSPSPLLTKFVSPDSSHLVRGVTRTLAVPSPNDTQLPNSWLLPALLLADRFKGGAVAEPLVRHDHKAPVWRRGKVFCSSIFRGTNYGHYHHACVRVPTLLSLHTRTGEFESCSHVGSDQKTHVHWTRLVVVLRRCRGHVLRPLPVYR